MARLLYLFNTDKLPICKCIEKVANEIVKIWNSVNIPVKRKDKVKMLIKKLYTKYVAVKKNRNRNASSQKIKEEAFTKYLKYLFDISTGDALSKVSKNVKDFLLCNKNEIQNKIKLQKTRKKLLSILEILEKALIQSHHLQV